METTAVFCHNCQCNRQASLNSSSFELECTTCSGDCVEQLDQGIEEFRNESADNTTSAEINQNQNFLSGFTQIENLLTSPLESQRQGRLLNLPVSVSVLNGNVLTENLQSNQSVLGLLASLNALQGQNGVLSTGFLDLPTGTIGGNISSSDETSQWENFLHYLLMNETSHAGAPPAPKQLLETLKRVEITNTTDTTKLGECCITQENFEVGDVLIPLPCGHNYKQEPIIHWLEMHNTCPVCRVEVTTAVADAVDGEV